MKIHKNYAVEKFKKELGEACHMYILHGIRNASASRVRLHFDIANCVFEFKTGKITKNVIVEASDYNNFKSLLKIHDELQKITGFLDNTIGYPLEKGAYVDTILLGKRLTKKVIEIFNLEMII